MKVSPVTFLLFLLSMASFAAGGYSGTTWSVALGMVGGFTLGAVGLHLLAWHIEPQYRRTVRRLLRNYLPPSS